ncbi:unnamed protein product, partial [Strongylus vulgaris]
MREIDGDVLTNRRSHTTQAAAAIESLIMQSLVILVALGLYCISVSAKMQNVTVKGITVCNKKRLANVHVE